MKKSTVIIPIATALAAVLCIGAFLFFYKIDVLGHEERLIALNMEFEGEEIDSVQNLGTALRPFLLLQNVDLGDYAVTEDEKQFLESEFPRIRFVCTQYVTVYGKDIQKSSENIDLTDVIVTELGTLRENMSRFPNVKSVDLGDNLFSKETKDAIISEYPNITFRITAYYEVEEKKVREDTKELDLSGISSDADIDSIIAPFLSLETVILKDTEIPYEDQLRLVETYPDLFFLWDVNMGPKYVSSDAETLGFLNMRIANFEFFKTALKLFPKAAYCDLEGTGLSNEQMQQLRETYPSVKFAWRIYLGTRWSLRTDAVAFSVLIYDYSHKRMTTEDIQVLKYCTDLKALDIGHQAVDDISVIGEYLKELRLLIIADNRVSDLSPVAELKHLHYFEFFVNRVSDLTPLASCKELVDLNISYNYGIRDITPLLDLPLLERLWLEHIPVSNADVILLRSTYPNAKIVSVGEGSVDNGWRYHVRYSEMRDMFKKKDYISEEFSKYDGLTEPPVKTED